MSETLPKPSESGTNQPAKKPGWFSFRIWHMFVIIAIAAWFAPKITVFGNCQAVMEIEKMQINEDKQWKKHWATFDCRFRKPNTMAGEPMHCFIEVDSDFTFGDKYQVGDFLKFRFQFEDYGSWKREDPRVIVFREFFDMEVLPSKLEDGLYILRGGPRDEE